MNAGNSETTFGDLKIKFVDALPKDLENRKERGHIEHEASKGIRCDQTETTWFDIPRQAAFS